MKIVVKEFIHWIKWDYYKPLIALQIGLLVSAIVWKITSSLLISIIVFFVTSLTIMIIMVRRISDRYAYGYSKVYGKQRSADPEQLRGHSKNMDDLLDLDKELKEFFDKYSDGTYYEIELNKQWGVKEKYFKNKADKILSNMNNSELMYGLLGTEIINMIIDIFKYFKPYEIDIEKLKEHPELAKDYYIDMIKKQNEIYNMSINSDFYNAILHFTKFEELEKAILSCMDNEQLMDLANSSESWYKKIYYYGFIKKDESVKTKLNKTKKE